MEDNDLDYSFATGGEYELGCAIELYGQPLLRCGTSLSSWLYSIAYNTCIDYLRKKKLLFFIPQKQTSSDSNFISDDLKIALLVLSPEERALVFSRVIDNKSYAELEVIYKASATTLRKRYERAKTKLSKILQETNPYYKRLEEMK